MTKLLLFEHVQTASPICLLLIFLFSMQRVYSKKHTFLQVMAGIFIGIIFAYIYAMNQLGPICMLYIGGV